ncbi:hypothetical protein GUJ93_ZPchr0013g34784 [Zizania palustris]|uniref:Uncharacterized protein n=1 Tax=Zizania palustris TaxID=103762 RepID=A0A8J6C0K2_ZIZPA|nr:hypothetical protein GUJ93_ZPchr0013g34784 [Zizania palustris]
MQTVFVFCNNFSKLLPCTGSGSSSSTGSARGRHGGGCVATGTKLVPSRKGLGGASCVAAVLGARRSQSWRRRRGRQGGGAGAGELLVAYVVEENITAAEDSEKERFDHPYIAAADDFHESILFYNLNTLRKMFIVKDKQ